MTPKPGPSGRWPGELCAWIDRLFPDAERGERLERALDERFGDDARAVTGDLCREIEAVAHDFSRHFALEYVADGSLVPDTEPPGWPPQDPREVAAEGGLGRRGHATPRGRGRARARRPGRRAHRRALLEGRVRPAARRPRRGAGPAAQRRWRSGDRDARPRLAARRRAHPHLRRDLQGPHAPVVDDRAARGPGDASRDAGQRARRRADLLVGRSARLPPPEPGERQSRRAADAGRWGSHHARARHWPRPRVPAGSPRPRRRHRKPTGKARASCPTSPASRPRR